MENQSSWGSVLHEEAIIDLILRHKMPAAGVEGGFLRMTINIFIQVEALKTYICLHETGRLCPGGRW